METNLESSVQETATDYLLEKYQKNNLVTYNISLMLLKSLKETSVITAKDYDESLVILNKKHGLNLSSLFASNDLI